MSFFDLPDPQFQLTPEAQLPQPQFRAGNGQPAVTGGTGGRNPYMDFLRRSRPQTGATLPAVYNGGQQQAADDNPVRSDVVTALGGRGGQMPSLQQFLASMPQSQSVSFGSGHGQIANGLGIGGPPTQHYTPATQGPTQASDHTNAGMAAFGSILGQYTTGPDSPSQHLARVNAALNETLKTRAEYDGPNSLSQQRINSQLHLADKQREQDLARFLAGQIQAGVDEDTALSQYRLLHSQTGLTPIGSTAGTGQAGMQFGQQGNPGGNAAQAGGAPAIGGNQAGGGNAQTQAVVPNPQQALLGRLYQRVSNNYLDTAGQPGAGAPRVRSFVNNNNQDVVHNALTSFVNSVPQELLQTPEGLNAFREFVTRPEHFGLPNFNRWFQARPTGRSLLHWFPTEEQQAHADMIDRVTRARNAVAGPNDQIGSTTSFGWIPLSRNNPVQ